jgi:hypothetical protein
VANGEMQSVIASVIAMVPLGLVLLMSVASAVGGLRLAREQLSRGLPGWTCCALIRPER